MIQILKMNIWNLDPSKLNLTKLQDWLKIIRYWTIFIEWTLSVYTFYVGGHMACMQPAEPEFKVHVEFMPIR